MDDTELSFGAPLPGSEPFRVGERVGPYHLRRLLGRGGMSHVFEADDTTMARKVAIKVVDDVQLGGPMLVREAQALAAVRHPGLPAVHTLGVHRGWSYLVFERVFGITLEEHLIGSTGPVRLGAEQALPILASVAEVLAAVHAAGMAHRDLKPSNVMLSPGHRVVLLDFGIVLPEVDAAGSQRCGTPRYLAPEIAIGKVTPGQAHLIDVYAFGAMAFEMFAGRPLFESPCVISLLEHHRSTPPPDLAEARPDLPPTIARLVASCLAKDPADRPEDLEAVAFELRTLSRRLVQGSGPVRVTTGGVRSAREINRSVPRPERPVAAGTAPEILIVEDDEDICAALSTFLTARGYRAHVASHGREALERLHDGGCRPSLILLDLSMPVMDGHGFLASQATDRTLEDIPVVVVTAQPPTQALAFASVRAVIEKPLRASTLLEMVERICDGASPGR